MNQLYYGDNLNILREHIRDESVDLVYLDPPFNSKATYNVLFKTPNGHDSDAQIEAFDDSWHWGGLAEKEFAEILHQSNTQVAEMMQSFRQFLGENDMMAYLVMMANRLLELHRVLKPTGSIYLHCDPTASHYLKIVLDSIFGPHNFRNEIIWKRTSAHSSARRYGPVHDIILFFSKTDAYRWNKQFTAHDEHYISTFYRHRDISGRLYRLSDLTAAGVRHGSSGKPWRGIDIATKGNHWKFTIEHLDQLDSQGRIYWPSKGNMPSYIRYLDEVSGIALQDIFLDLPPVGAQAKERLGYPTQKPLALIERIIISSSNERDLVLDPFCGCGTAIHAAEKLQRKWIGIDITHLSISLIEKRLRDAFPGIDFKTHGTPKDVAGATDLARRDKYQFQWWACSLVNAQPAQGKKKGADSGVDGLIFFQDNDQGAKKIVVSVKSGEHISVSMIRDLKGVLDRERAEIGLFITMAEPTKPMLAEAASAGLYQPAKFPDKTYPRIQLLTIEDLLSGRRRAEYPDLTMGGLTFKKAMVETDQDKQKTLF